MDEYTTAIQLVIGCILFLVSYFLQVADTWNLGFETGYLSHNYDIIIVYADARGTLGRGERYKYSFINILKMCAK
jgi:hypothetical protein